MRYMHKLRIAGLLRLAAAAVLSLSAAPAGATQLCPPGTTNPAYCTNVPPIAVTAGVADVGGFDATIQGVAGPGVPNGDVTQYYFEYGTTIHHLEKTRTRTIGSCPPAVTNPLYCSVPPAEFVEARLRRLEPNRRYHYHIVAVNSDGETIGLDRTFRTAKVRPIRRSERRGKPGITRSR